MGPRRAASAGQGHGPILDRYAGGVPKLTPKIILEGTRLTHKTDLAFALNEHPRIVGPRRYRYHSPLISAEWCGFTPFPWGRGPITFEPGGEEQERAMAVFDAWVRLIELQPYYSWIIDRFHLSARSYQLAEHGLDLDFTALEARLLALDVHLVLCTRRDGTWEDARAERLLVSGNPSQYDDPARFRREQDLLRRLAGESALPVLELDTSDGDVADACDRIADWMSSTGGLWPRGHAPSGPTASRSEPSRGTDARAWPHGANRERSGRPRIIGPDGTGRGRGSHGASTSPPGGDAR